MDKTLLKTNKYLRNPKTREAIILENAIASAAIEGVRNARKLAEEILNDPLTMPRQTKAKTLKHKGRHRRVVPR